MDKGEGKPLLVAGKERLFHGEGLIYAPHKCSRSHRLIQQEGSELSPELAFTVYTYKETEALRNYFSESNISLPKPRLDNTSLLVS